MELLVAFLIAFGVLNASEAEKLKSSDDAQALISKTKLDKEYIIWEAEGDDF